MNTITIVLAAIGLLVGVGVGYYLRMIVALGKQNSMELDIKTQMLTAKEEAQKIMADAQAKAEAKIKETEAEEKKRLEDVKKAEERIIKREDTLDAKDRDIQKHTDDLNKKIEEVNKIKLEVEERKLGLESELEKISGLTREEAREQLFKEIESRSEEDTLVRMQKLENASKEKLDARAREILATSIQRLANDGVGEMMASTVSIPSDEIKGKIIGKEGRNIRAFERASGVELIVDDTPGVITISSFDPVRRQVARIALENLILDGRIQPAKIEEMVEKAKEDINKIIKQKALTTAACVGCVTIDRPSGL
jgi:ribonuclease Y